MNYFFLFIYWFWIIIVIFFLLKHPLIIGLLLTVNTFFLCIFIKTTSFSCWNSYILFLIFLGGVLILFLYNISLISSEIFFYIIFKEIIIIFILIIIFFLFYKFKERLRMDIIIFFNLKNCLPIIFLFLNINIIIFIIIYLFLTLICVVNLIYLIKDKGSFFTPK